VRKIAWLMLTLLMVIVLFLTACGNKTTTSTTTTSSTTTSATITTSSTTATSTSTVKPTTGVGNWWDKFGEPQYGGTITYGTSSSDTTFDNMTFIGSQFNAWLETPFTRDWTLDRTKWAFNLNYVPDFAYVGHLVESWESSDPVTMILHMRKGVYFQNKPPVNGRELTADDVAQHYARQLGNGYGYTKPSAMNARFLTTINTATAKDKYTVEIKFKQASAVNFNTLAVSNAVNQIEAPEVVKLEGGTLKDWKNAVGTGPWILTDFVTDSSRTFSRNSNYWGYDERYPKNKIPYADTLKILIIPDISTRIAAIRAGKVDVLDTLTMSQAQLLQDTNHELIMTKRPNTANSLNLRCDTAPFTDINVRMALQMAIDLPTITKSYYKGTIDPSPCGLVNPANSLFSFSYADWPQSLKDEYAYNPTKAKQLLKEAGFPNGFKTNCIADPSRDPDLLQIVKAYFLEIGVDMEIRVMETGARQAFVSAGKHDQMVQESDAQTSAPYPNNLSIRGPSPASNYTYHNDTNFYAITDKCASATTVDDLVKYVKEADRYAIGKHWSIITSPPVPSFTFYQPYLKGTDTSELTFLYQGPVEYARLWIDKNLKASMGR
jgi:peptide/nickel transport system substrate-binding protein